MQFIAVKTIPISEVLSFIGNVSSVSMEMDVSFIDYAWDLIFMQDEIIRSDSQYIVDHQSGKIHPSVVLETQIIFTWQKVQKFDLE